MKTRAFDEKTDATALRDLLYLARAGKTVNRELTLTRLQFFLTTRLHHPEQNSRIWYNQAGEWEAVAFLIQRNGPTSPFDLWGIYHPDYNRNELFQAMLTWAQERTASLIQQRQQGNLLRLVTMPPKEPEADRNFLTEAGFNPSPADNVTMSCVLSSSETLPELVVPENFRLGELQAENFAAYVALFNQVMRDAVTLEKYQRFAAHPNYNSTFRLVVERVSDRQLVAFAEFSADQQEWQVSGKREAWITHVGTHPDFRRQGFGSLITLATLHQLQKLGVEKVSLVTGGTNPAQNIYRKLGFKVDYRWVLYWQEVVIE